MRTSCNGCRVLRKACGDDCPIRPCLHWITTSPSQSNATLFLAKFYGRAGLLNLLHSGPANLRPSIFKSLLYEACGRIINPVYGSAGLFWSGSWHLCQAAVDAVLTGAPIAQVSSESAVGCATPPLEASDIRHKPKTKSSAAGSDRLRKVRSRRRFKRSASKTRRGEADEARRDQDEGDEPGSHDSRGSQGSAANKELVEVGAGEQDEGDEPGSHDSRGSQGSAANKELVEVGAGEQAVDGGHSELEPGLELSLGLEPSARRAPEERQENTDGCGGDAGVLASGLDVRR